MIKRVLALMLCLVLCLALAACGNDQTTNSSSTSASDGSNAATEPAASTGTTEATVGSNQAMEAFIANIQDEIDDMTASLQESGMNLKVVARGNSLAYVYQYNTDLGDTSLVKDALEQSLDSMASVFTSVLSSLKEAVPDAESVIVEYLDQDGNVIVSKEFQ